MYIKIEDIIFRLKKRDNIDGYHFSDEPNKPTVFIDTNTQLKLIKKFFSVKDNKKRRKISGYYETKCFKYTFRNFKLVSTCNDENNQPTVSFTSKAVNRSWNDQSLYTKEDLNQIESLEIINKFNL